jgi:hypothetical protein
MILAIYDYVSSCYSAAPVTLLHLLLCYTCYSAAPVTLLLLLLCCSCYSAAPVTLLHLLLCCSCYSAAPVTLLLLLLCCSCYSAAPVTLLHLLLCCSCYSAAPVTLLHLFPCLIPFLLSLPVPLCLWLLSPVPHLTTQLPCSGFYSPPLRWIPLRTCLPCSKSASSNLSLHIWFFCNSSELPRICTPYLSV